PRPARGCARRRECECGADDRRGDRDRDAVGGAGPPDGMTEIVDTDAGTERTERVRSQCLCETFARVTERSALAGARWLGRADKEAAEEAAFSGARIALEQMPISGHVVIGGHEDADQLAAGSTIGAGGEEYDLALDPLEGSG